MYSTKNYTDRGGSRLVIGGELDVIGEGRILKDGVPVELGGGSSGPVAWEDVTNKPTTFVPAAHTHNASDINAGTLDVARIPTLAQSKVTNLTTDLAAKIPKSAVAGLTAIAAPASATAEEVATAFNNLLAALKA